MAVRRLCKLFVTLSSVLPCPVPLPLRGVVASFTTVNGRVWGGTPSLSLRERGQGVWKKMDGETSKMKRLAYHKVNAFSDV